MALCFLLLPTGTFFSIALPLFFFGASGAAGTVVFLRLDLVVAAPRGILASQVLMVRTSQSNMSTVSALGFKFAIELLNAQILRIM